MKILIADDHWLMRKSLKEVLQRLDPSNRAFEASSFEECIGLLETEKNIDLVFADLVMPGFNELEGLTQLRSAFPQVPVVVVSVHEDRERVLRALDLGVIGYIPKSATGNEIAIAFERVLAGEIYFPRRLIERVKSLPEPTTSLRPTAIGQIGSEPPLEALTAREREVLGFLGKGLSVPRIATELGLSHHTTRTHLSNLMRKLNLPDRSAAIHYAINLSNARGNS